MTVDVDRELRAFVLDLTEYVSGHACEIPQHMIESAAKLSGLGAPKVPAAIGVDVAKVRALLAAAQVKPWSVELDRDDDGEQVWDVFAEWRDGCHSLVAMDIAKEPDAALIAAAPALMAEMADEIERLRGEADRETNRDWILRELADLRRAIALAEAALRGES